MQKDLDIAEYTDPGHNPMIPYTIVLEPGLVIYKIYNGYWFFGRPTVEELRQDLRAVTKKCRPDWDITTPELKAAWQEGQRNSSTPMERRTPKRSVNRICGNRQEGPFARFVRFGDATPPRSRAIMGAKRQFNLIDPPLG